jgi:xanthine dehydrogenase molybdenum-binding subunit
MSDTYTVIGTRPPRVDAPAKVTGQALFGTDISLPGMLHGKILRSPHAHARLLKVDTSRAEALPGVYAVVTAQDLPAGQDAAQQMDEGSASLKYVCDNTLASDKVLYVGHAVAAVAVAEPHIAEQALRLIEVEYEPLPAVVDVLEAARPGAPLLHGHIRTPSPDGMEAGSAPSNIAAHYQALKGDPAQGFAEADAVVEREFRTLAVHQGYLEPHASTALWGPDGAIVIYTCTQGAFAVRDAVAELLQYPMSKIKVIPTEVGGAFGGKNVSYFDAVAALLSRKAGRPVRIVMNRAEVLLATGPSSGTAIRVKMGATRAGRITAAQAELYYEAGAYPGSPVGSGMGTMFGPYDIPNGQLDGYDVLVNKPRVSTYRAPGATPAVFAVEAVVDELAEQIGLDPLEFRLRNCAHEGTRHIDGDVHVHVGARQVLEAARAHAHYTAPLKGPNRGRGIAFGYWGNWGSISSCTLSVNADGTVALLLGSVDVTGTRTSLAMQAAEVLGLPLERVRPTVGDTDQVGYTEVSAGSRTTFATGIAVVKAAEDVIAQMRARAAEMWDLPVEAVEFDRGRFSTGGDDPETMDFDELAAQLNNTGGPITGVGNVDVREWGVTFGLHIADVEVDPETGGVTLLRYTAVQDAGRAIHPAEVEGQIQGGATQGIGWALWEGYRYSADGQMLNPTLLDYKMPTALDLPPIEAVIVEVPYPKHPFGLRGAGEMPIIPPPGALANAIYRASGARVEELPMTPQHILTRMGVL